MVQLGWTLFNLFDSSRQLNKGLWQLPLYQAPLEAHLDIRAVDALRPIPMTLLCLRITHAQDEMDQNLKLHDPRDASDINIYQMPEVHERAGRLYQEKGLAVAGNLDETESFKER